MARIAVAGFQHETNTFAPLIADMAAFERPDEWPGLCVGADLLAAVEGVNLPAAGAVAGLEENGHEVIPLVWCSATPSGKVSRDAFEGITALILERLRGVLPVDGLYLDLHGAMVCEHLDDGEGELLRRLRAALGYRAPIVVSLDLHANISPQMFAVADVLDCYRTYPHVDMAETGYRTADAMHRILNRRRQSFAYGDMRRFDFLIPHNWASTLAEPARSLYEAIINRPPEIDAACFATGFPLADVAIAQPAAVAYGSDRNEVEEFLEGFTALVETKRTEFRGELLGPRQGIRRALGLGGGAPGPVVIADTQDNPGGGGPGDTVGLLRALIDEQARGAVFATVADPVCAAMAHDAGEGSEIDMPLGEKSGLPDHQPLHGRYRVLRLANGCFRAHGSMYRGAEIHMGPTALLEIEGIRVVVSTIPVQVADLGVFHHVGIDPHDETLICLKSSVHFRCEFQDLAQAIILVAAPGPVAADPRSLPYQHIPPERIEATPAQSVTGTR